VFVTIVRTPGAGLEGPGLDAVHPVIRVTPVKRTTPGVIQTLAISIAETNHGMIHGITVTMMTGILAIAGGMIHGKIAARIIAGTGNAMDLSTIVTSPAVNRALAS
jgi:hypothetical protein